MRNLLASSLSTIALAVFFSGLSTVTLAQETDPLDWPEPTVTSRPGCYWWWPGSAVDKENLTWNLETMNAAGMGGGTIVPIYGVKGYEDRFLKHLSPKWLEMLDHAVKEADRLGMWVDMTTGTGWPFGGPNVPESEADAQVVYEDGEVSIEFSGRMVKRAAPGGEGYAINPFSTQALQNYLKKFDQAFSEHDVQLPRAQYHDSFEYSGNWCPDFFAEFQKLRGYDLRDHLEAFFEGKGDADTVARIKSDYRETLSDLHLRYITEWDQWAQKWGCTTRNQAHGAPGNLLDLYAAAGIPETETFGASKFEIPGIRRDPDNVRHQDRPRSIINRMASSAAHVAGRRLVASESCTWIRNHFRTALSQAKPELDQLMLAGINHIFYHGCCYSPKDADWPGWLFYASWEANPRNSIWNDIDALNCYVTRCQSILQAGQPDNDVLLYWPVYDIYHDPSGLRKQLAVHRDGWIADEPSGAAARWLVDSGYAFDFISDQQIAKLKCVDHKLATAGNEYTTIAVPRTGHMPVRTLEALVSLAKEGATVLFFDRLPETVPGYGDLDARSEEFEKIKSNLDFKTVDQYEALHAAEVGDGRILHSEHHDQLMKAAATPREPMVDSGLKFIRRRRADGVDYFIANMADQNLSRWFSIARPCRSAVLMDANSGRTGVAPVRQKNGAAEVYLQIEPGETRILRTYENREVEGDAWKVIASRGEPVSISGEWKVEFIEGGPELPKPFTTTELKSWTKLGGEEAKRFAGTARYRIEFDLPETDADNWVLDIGEVRESAEVRVNGEKVDVLFSVPFHTRIGNHLKPGRNVLELDVTNLSANRIRDLDKRGVEWKKFYDINFVNHNYDSFDASKWEITPSGLLGPVTLTPVETTAQPEFSKAALTDESERAGNMRRSQTVAGRS